MPFKIIAFAFSIVLFSSSIHAAKIYDFATRNAGTNAFAYEGVSGTHLPPNQNFPSDQHSDSEYTKISANDGTKNTISTNQNNTYPMVRYVFELDEAEADIEQLDFFWNGSGINYKHNQDDGVVLYLWNDNNGSYEQIATSGDTSSDVDLTHTITANIANYIDGNNGLTLLVVSNDSARGTSTSEIRADYVSIEVESNSTPKTPIFSPSDSILGGQLDNRRTFNIGIVGTSSGANNWPSNELPENLIDGVGQKYLNFGELDTGAIITPAIGCSVVDTIKFWTANDEYHRDPASYKLYGTNRSVSGLSHSLSDFTLLSEGDLTLPSSRNNDGNSALDDSNSQTISFENTSSYTSYLLFFPTVKNQGRANSMQLGEVQVFGSAKSCSPTEVIAGRVTLKNTMDDPAFTSVCFDTPFSEVPRVFSLPTTGSNGDRLALRIRNVTEKGFEIAQVESAVIGNSNSPAGNLSQTVDFLAIPEGDYILGGGAKMRVSALNTTRFQGKHFNDTSWETVGAASMDFSQAPAVIASIQTMNNEADPFPISFPFLATTIQSVTSTQFKVALERGETRTGSLDQSETVAYIAVTPGMSGQLTDDISYESFLTNNNVSGINYCRTVSLNGNYSAGNPLVIASQNTRNGADGGWLKRCAISTSSVGFSIVEDMASDLDQNHTNEQAGGIALGGVFTNQTCSVQPVDVHHYEITHDGQGLTCEAEFITVKACTNADCSSVSSEEVTLDVLADGRVISSQVAFTGSTNISFNHTTAETLTFSVAKTSVTASNPSKCNGSTGNACDMTFTEAGFRFLSGAGNSTTVPNQISGSEFSEALKIQAVKDTNGVCTGLFTNAKSVNLWQENVDPGGTDGLRFNVDGNPLAKRANVTSTSLTFGANSIATIPTPVYQDAGQIRLHADYDDGTVQLTGSSNPFWVSPDRLAVIAKSGSINLDGSTAAAITTHKAGEDFDLIVSAYNANNVITPNYSPGQMQLKLERTGPTLTGSLDGNFSYAAASTLQSSTTPVFTSVSLANFVSGVSTYSEVKYSEVGLLNLDIQDSNYGHVGITVDSAAIDIGRFTPDHFKQTVAEHGELFTTCGAGSTFAYTGQTDALNPNIGAILYDNPPILEITAYNKQGVITRNYDGDFIKLSAGDVSVVAPTFDAVNNSSLVANIDTGILSQTDLTTLSNGTALPKGVSHYQLSALDHFVYSRGSGTEVAPYTSAFELVVGTISDVDGVDLMPSNGLSTTESASPEGIEIRFGRLVLQNSFGPAAVNLTQPLQVEYFNGSNFVVSSDDNCLGYDVGKLEPYDINDLDPSETQSVGVNGSFSDGKTSALQLKAPDAAKIGDIGVRYNLEPNHTWLQYDWDNGGDYDDNPLAIATFGLFRGNDRVIYRRVVN